MDIGRSKTSDISRHKIAAWDIFSVIVYSLSYDSASCMVDGENFDILLEY